MREIARVAFINTVNTAPRWRLHLGKPIKLDQSQTPLESAGCARDSAGKP